MGQLPYAVTSFAGETACGSQRKPTTWRPSESSTVPSPSGGRIVTSVLDGAVSAGDRLAKNPDLPAFLERHVDLALHGAGSIMFPIGESGRSEITRDA